MRPTLLYSAIFSPFPLTPKYMTLNDFEWLFTLNFRYYEPRFQQNLGYIIIVELFIKCFCCMTSRVEMCGSGPRSAEYCGSVKGLRIFLRRKVASIGTLTNKANIYSITYCLIAFPLTSKWITLNGYRNANQRISCAMFTCRQLHWRRAITLAI